MLVVRREFSTFVKSKGYISSTLTMMILVIVAMFVAYIGKNHANSLDFMKSAEIAGKAQNSVLLKHGVNPVQFSQEVAQKTAELTKAAHINSPDTIAMMISIGVGVIIFMSLVLTGQAIANGVAQEKASRTVEILLSLLKPWELLAGKVIGIGLTGILQILLIVGSGALAAIGFGVIDASVITTHLGAGLWIFVWFILAYFSYACFYAALGSRVNSIEEVSSSIALIQIIIVMAFYVSIYAPMLGKGVAWLVTLSAYVPLFSPFNMPAQIILGKVEWWQIVASLALTLIFIPVAVWACSRIYQNSIVNTGGKQSLIKLVAKNVN